MKRFRQAVFNDYLLIIFGSALVGLSFNLFLLPARLAAGGVSGISTITYELYGFNPAIVQWLINIPLFILAVILAGRDFSMKSLVGTLFVPLTIWMTGGLKIGVEDPFLASIYGGILLGVGLGIVYRGNGSTGGTALIAQILKKFTGLSSGFAQLIVDGAVVLTSAFVFDFELALFALIAIYVTSKVIDFVQLRTSPQKLILIITEREEEVRTIIRDEIDRGLTKLRVTGGHSNKERTMILCVAEQAEAVYLKKMLNEKEPSSFVIFVNASEILGHGFSKERIYE